jgi:predicted ArsR family transcriptional regulator
MVGTPLADDRAVMRAVIRHPDPVVESNDLLDLLPYESANGVRRRLIALEEDGFLRSKQIGGRGRIWWATHAGREFAAPEEST